MQRVLAAAVNPKIIKHFYHREHRADRSGLTPQKSLVFFCGVSCLYVLCGKNFHLWMARISVASAASLIASHKVGWEWGVVMMLSTVNCSRMASAASAINSEA